MGTVRIDLAAGQTAEAALSQYDAKASREHSPEVRAKAESVIRDFLKRGGELNGLGCSASFSETIENANGKIIITFGHQRRNLLARLFGKG